MSKENLNKLPDLETIRKGIEELLLIDNWDNYKIKSSPKRFERRFHQLFTSKLEILPRIIEPVRENSFRFKFYRLRKFSKSMNPSLISEYSYPPNHEVKSIQRANLPYHPVSYCSDNPMTAIFETARIDKRHSENSLYYLSEWQLRSDVEIRLCTFLFGIIDETSPYKILADNSELKIRELLKDYDKNQIDGMIEILKYLSKLFIYDNTYVVSSFIAHNNIYPDDNYRADIFIYPSVQTDRKTVNYAIHPNAVTEKLLLQRVFKLRVPEIHKENGSFQINVSKVAKNIDGILYWSSVNSDTEEGKTNQELINDMFYN